MNQFLVEVTVYLYPQIIDVYVYDVGIRIKVLVHTSLSSVMRDKATPW